MKILDVCCKAGGASVGYSRAFPGARIIGVDIEPQKNYPFEFVRADAVWLLRDMVERDDTMGFDFIHASPPCQRWSDLGHRNANASSWPDLIEPIRESLLALGLPYVIENVERAPLINPITLCGTMFPGLRVLRHRLFECSFPVAVPPHGKHPLVFTHDKRKAHYGQLDQDTSFVQVTGGGNATIANKAAAMGIDWMSGAELNEAIPPAYTHWIGNCLREQLSLHL